MRQSTTALLIAAAFAFLTGCGQTGPLYMPVEDVPKPPPAAPEQGVDKSSDNS